MDYLNKGSKWSLEEPAAPVSDNSFAFPAPPQGSPFPALSSLLI